MPLPPFSLSISNAFKLFDQNISLTGGGPVNSTQMLALNIYNTAFGENRFGLDLIQRNFMEL